MEINKKVGLAIRSKRRAMDISQGNFAKSINTLQARISLIEHGHIDLRLTELQRIAAALGVDPIELMRGEVR